MRLGSLELDGRIRLIAVRRDRALTRFPEERVCSPMVTPRSP